MTSSSRTTPSAAQRWREMVEGEHAQSERARESGQPPADHWAGVAERFREDPLIHVNHFDRLLSPGQNDCRCSAGHPRRRELGQRPGAGRASTLASGMHAWDGKLPQPRAGRLAGNPSIEKVTRGAAPGATGAPLVEILGGAWGKYAADLQRDWLPGWEAERVAGGAPHQTD